jgi:zinc transport system ATP-binding protein
MSEIVAESHGLVIGYGKTAILPPLDLTLRRGSVWLIVGRNGSGKSTFVRTFLGLLAPVVGRVERRADLRMSYVPQATELDPAVPVRGADITAWGRLRGWGFLRPYRSAADRVEMRRALADLDASALERQRFGEMSGGQRQRVLLAQMLAGDAELAVLDEPTAAMDAATERAAYERLRELVHTRGMTALIVTHAVAVAAPFADHIAFFDPDDRSAPAGRVHVGDAREIAGDPRFETFFGRVATGSP